MRSFGVKIHAEEAEDVEESSASSASSSTCHYLVSLEIVFEFPPIFE
jgi:hypothetical protein